MGNNETPTERNTMPKINIREDFGNGVYIIWHLPVEVKS